MTEKNISIPLLIGGLVLIVTIGAARIFIAVSRPPTNTPNSASNSNNSTLQDTNLQSSTNTMTSTTDAGSQGIYKDGTYSATGDYIAPSGPETVGVSLTLSNGVISTVSTTINSHDPDAVRYERRFSQGISGIVIGKTLDDAFVSGRVNGSSLTGDGFNAALETIKQEATR